MTAILFEVAGEFLLQLAMVAGFGWLAYITARGKQ